MFNARNRSIRQVMDFEQIKFNSTLMCFRRRRRRF